MGNKSFSTIMKKLDALEKELRELMIAMTVNEPLIAGSLSLVMRTCGKSNCHCADEPCHQHLTLMTAPEGKRRCQVVRKADVEDVTELVEQYRQFRKALKHFRAIEIQRYALLKEFLDARNTSYE